MTGPQPGSDQPVRPVHVVAASHGTDNPHGQEQINRLRQQLAEQAAGHRALRDQGVELIWHEAYVDVQHPQLPEVLKSLPEGEAALVLPLLVADGVHTTEDIAGAVAGRANTVAAAPLGVLPALAAVLANRAEPHLRGATTVVLAAAGTRLPAGQQQISELAGQLSRRLGRGVQVGYCAGAEPRVPALVQGQAGQRTLVLSALLAEGFFQDKLRSTGAWQVTTPLLPDVMIAQCFLERLFQALEEAAWVTKKVEVEGR